MDSAITRLLKVLELERKQGYRNKAVIGGLDKFASRWEADARAETGNSAVIGEVVSLLLGYAVVEDRAARERILDLITRRTQTLSESGSERESQDAEAPAAPKPPMPGETLPAGERPKDRVAPERAVAERPAAERDQDRSAADRADAERTTAERSGQDRSAPERTSQERGEALVPKTSKPVSQAPADTRAPASRPPEVVPAAPRVEPPPPPELAEESPAAGHEEASPESRQEARPEPRAAHHRAGPGLDAPVTRLPGVGPAFAQKLGKLGVETVRDLLYLLPFRYNDLSQLRTIDKLKVGEEVTVIGTVWEVRSRDIGNDRKVVTARVGDGTGEMQMTWFNPWIEKQLRIGQAYSFGGKVDSYRSMLVMRSPEFEPLDRTLLSTG
ncbi:MAG: OB-fold nucleic acid binding domain-containing protein, partial [Nitrososphaerales archaeon]